ncbi:MAG: HigA family addiction module antitoxin [Candidatus Gastranaerophilales bacterium]|nr:HigA family addiction module antitoxin [Candidatus Gastranaerophilales bacterium]
MEMFNPPHPGETLKELYLNEYHITIAELALKTGISRKHLSNIVNAKVPITTETALKLAKCFNTSAEVWLREQLVYDLWKVRQSINLDNVVQIAL